MLRSIKTFAIGAGAALTILSAGCGGSSGTATAPAASAPRVLSLTPADGATDVGATATITATFDMPMDASSVQNNMHVYEGDPQTGTMVPGAMSWNETNTVMTFTPSAAMAPGATHTIHFNAGMAGASNGHMMSGGGHMMTADQMASFMTQPEVAP